MQLYRLLSAAAAASDGTGTSRVGYRRWGEGGGRVGEVVGCGRWGGRGRRRYGMTERCKRRTGRSSDRSLAAAAAGLQLHAPLLRQRPARCRPFHRFPGRV